MALTRKYVIYSDFVRVSDGTRPATAWTTTRSFRRPVTDSSARKPCHRNNHSRRRKSRACLRSGLPGCTTLPAAARYLTCGSVDMSDFGVTQSMLGFVSVSADPPAAPEPPAAPDAGVGHLLPAKALSNPEGRRPTGSSRASGDALNNYIDRCAPVLDVQRPRRQVRQARRTQLADLLGLQVLPSSRLSRSRSALRSYHGLPAR